jgi:hypothetical protein
MGGRVEAKEDSMRLHKVTVTMEYWDVPDDLPPEEWEAYLREHLPTATRDPLIFSAPEEKRLRKKIADWAQSFHEAVFFQLGRKDKT